MDAKLNSKDAFTKRAFGRLMRVWLQSSQDLYMLVKKFHINSNSTRYQKTQIATLLKKLQKVIQNVRRGPRTLVHKLKTNILQFNNDNFFGVSLLPLWTLFKNSRATFKHIAVRNLRKMKDIIYLCRIYLQCQRERFCRLFQLCLRPQNNCQILQTWKDIEWSCRKQWCFLQRISFNHIIGNIKKNINYMPFMYEKWLDIWLWVCGALKTYDVKRISFRFISLQSENNLKPNRRTPISKSLEL